MKRLILAMFSLTALAGFAAMMTWWIVGPPDRSVPCVESNLKEGQICLETVLSWPSEEVLWIDARPRGKWEKNGVQDSLLFNDDKAEDWDAFDEAFMIVQATAPRKNVVVYCNTEGCGSSDTVAQHLREDFAEMLGFKVWVLYGGWKALAAQDMIREN